MVGPAGLVYLDYAATAAIRPDAVITATVAYLRDVGATPGRGGHRLAVQADRTALHCRQSIARLLGISGDPGRIAFLPNATYAINTALHGVLRSGDRVVTTIYDHNAVLRPIAALKRSSGLDVVQVRGDATGQLNIDDYVAALKGARLVVLNAVSNVLGTMLDIRPLAEAAHAEGALVLVDAAQAAGEVPFQISSSGADMVAFTGHKGLLGPQGTGGLWVREGVEVLPFASGGTGGDSMDHEMPAAYPDHLEAGTTNGVGIAGLGAGVDWLLHETVETVHRRTSGLSRRLREALCSIEGIRILSPVSATAPIVTFVSDHVDAATLAARLDRQHGVLARAGHHCAPDVHRLLGTEQSGAVRFSLGWATTEDDITRAADAVRSILSRRNSATEVG